MLNRLLTNMISRDLFRPDTPSDIPHIRTKVPPWRSDKDVNKFVSELQMDTAELSVRMSYEAHKIQWNCEGLTQADMNASLTAFIERYNLRIELQQIFAGYQFSFGPLQRRCTSRSPLTTRR